LKTNDLPATGSREKALKTKGGGAVFAHHADTELLQRRDPSRRPGSGAVERVYQIDIRIGPTAGYQKFSCSLGGVDFLFLTLNIVE
jgi:hypothetical protein